MASTKVYAEIWAAQNLAAAAGDTTSGVQTLDDGYGAALYIKLTNGGTGPTIAAQVQIQVSGDNAEYYDFGPALVGGLTIAGVYDWGGIVIPIGVEYLRLVAGSNTGQNVAVDADISEVTAL